MERARTSMRLANLSGVTGDPIEFGVEPGDEMDNGVVGVTAATRAACIAALTSATNLCRG